VNSNQWPRRSNHCGKKETDSKRKVCTRTVHILSLLGNRPATIMTVEAQGKELQDIRRNFVCGQCGKRSASARHITTSAPVKISKTAVPTSSRLVSLSGSGEKPSTSGTLRTVVASRQRTPRRAKLTPETHSAVRSTQLARPAILVSSGPVPKSSSVEKPTRSVLPSQQTPIQERHSAIPPTRPAQPISRATTQTSTFPNSQSAFAPSLSSESVSAVNDLTKRQSIIFNDEVEKVLDLEMVRVLHRGVINCVRFSRDGKYLAAACYDGRAYIYDAESGTLTWSALGKLPLGILADIGYLVSSEICLRKKTISMLSASVMMESISPLVHGIQWSM
jgi:WD40 repeat protein